MEPAASDVPLTYISEHLNSLVAVFRRDGKHIGTITNGLVRPQGIIVDANRNLWVANTNASNILKFARGALTASQTLSDPRQSPVDVAVCPNGTVYVSNFDSVRNPNVGSISIYTSGATKPTGTLKYKGQGNNFNVACDRSGNVFTTLNRTPCYSTCTSGGVVEYPNGKESSAIALPIALGFPGGIKVARSGDLLVVDQHAATVTEYTEAGVPTGKSVSTGSGDWVGIDVTRDGKAIVGADAALVQGTSLTFPAGNLRHQYSCSCFSLPLGAAFDPT